MVYMVCTKLQLYAYIIYGGTCNMWLYEDLGIRILGECIIYIYD